MRCKRLRAASKVKNKEENDFLIVLTLILLREAIIDKTIKYENN